MIPIPRSFQRLAAEIDGWLDLRCPEKALERLAPMLESPQGRQGALYLRVRALVALGRYEEALEDIAALRSSPIDPDWLDLTEAWCRKRVGDLPAAIGCMRSLLERNQRSAIGHFNLGCYLALSGMLDEALDEVTLACGIDEEFRSLANSERDLDALAGDPRFQSLLRKKPLA
ncbi:MAG: hypothetical protein Fur0037_03190 [Planctomycetota bacterium]